MAPTVLLLVGPPGSGKTTFANHLCAHDQSWSRVNQDDLGSRRQCEGACQALLTKGRNVVIDRCNFDASQRATWVRLAGRFSADIVSISFILSPEICRMRIMRRMEHPTGVTGLEGSRILDAFLPRLVYPQAAVEGIRMNLRITTPHPARPDKPAWLPESEAWTPEDVRSILLALALAPTTPTVAPSVPLV